MANGRSPPGHENERESPPENAPENHQRLNEENVRMNEERSQEQERRFAAHSQEDVFDIVNVIGKDKQIIQQYKVKREFLPKVCKGNDPNHYMDEIEARGPGKWRRCTVPHGDTMGNRRSVCGTEGTKGNVTKHINAYHMGKTAVYACPICVPEIDKEPRPMLMQNLKQHLGTKKHTDKTKLWCLVADCEHNCTDNTNHVAHCVKVHKRKVSKCPQCPFQFCFYEYYVEHIKGKGGLKHPGKPLPPEQFGMQALGYVLRRDRVDESNEESNENNEVMEENFSNNGEDSELDQMDEESPPHGRDDGSNQTYGSVQTNYRVDGYYGKSIGHSKVQMGEDSSTDVRDGGLTETVWFERQFYEISHEPINYRELPSNVQYMGEHFSTDGRDNDIIFENYDPSWGRRADSVLDQKHDSVQTNYRGDESDGESIGSGDEPMVNYPSNYGHDIGANQTYGSDQRYDRVDGDNEEFIENSDISMDNYHSPDGRDGGSYQMYQLLSIDIQGVETLETFERIERGGELTETGEHSVNGRNCGSNQIIGVIWPNGPYKMSGYIWLDGQDGRSYKMIEIVWLNGQGDGPYEMIGSIWLYGQDDGSNKMSGNIWLCVQDNGSYKMSGDIWLRGQDDEVHAPWPAEWKNIDDSEITPEMMDYVTN